MRNLRIYIHELGPIRNAEIELAPVMIFTGTSNLGKSYTNFLAYYVFSLFSGSRLAEFFRKRISDEVVSGKRVGFSFSVKELKDWMEADIKNFFVYMLNYPDVPCKVEFCFEDTDRAFHVKIQQAKTSQPTDELGNFKIMTVSIDRSETAFLSRNDKIADLAVIHIAQYLQKVLLDVRINHAYLLPPGRASLLNESFSIKKDVSNTGMYDIFLNDFDYIVNLKIRNNNATETDRNENLTKLTENIIEGKLVSTREGIVMNMKGQNNPIPISATASSIKELSPFLLWVENGKPDIDSMCIEEPEAHAHPEMQYGIADLMAACIMQGTMMQLTTHSDYLLARLNQLIRLHNLKQKDSNRFKDVCKTYAINESLTLDPSLIHAYFFHKNKESQEVTIKKMNVKDGIPFDTFSNVVQQQIDWEQIFNEGQDDETL